MEEDIQDISLTTIRGDIVVGPIHSSTRLSFGMIPLLPVWPSSVVFSSMILPPPDTRVFKCLPIFPRFYHIKCSIPLTADVNDCKEMCFLDFTRCVSRCEDLWRWVLEYTLEIGLSFYCFVSVHNLLCHARCVFGHIQWVIFETYKDFQVFS